MKTSKVRHFLKKSVTGKLLVALEADKNHDLRLLKLKVYNEVVKSVFR